MSLLRTLYALAIALLVVAFVGFGISAFYPGPEFPRAYPELEHGVVGENPTEEEKQMLAEEQKEMEAYEVSRRVNRPSNNDPSVVEPAA